jgi:hypothetical protein
MQENRDGYAAYAITSLSEVKTIAIVTITRNPLTIASLDFFTDEIAEVMG